MASPLGQLSRAEYCALASKMTGVGVEQRELIYDLYEQFDRRKRQLHLYDTMDVLRHLHAQQRQVRVRVRVRVRVNPHPHPHPHPHPNPNLTLT